METTLTKGQQVEITAGGRTVPAWVNGFQQGFGSRPGFWLLTMRKSLTDKVLGGGTYPLHMILAVPGAQIAAV
ncbi:MAG: hypothetical protein Unbinned3891contig1000_38 [Prokaryotic dsDNA virus sp.]|nr:MAG: hypothetical protein Unbinned3891contig1000_38 [Prokaryotic dsDNA virus sp.]|tara:strand:- start:71797 stop:72015 length:219 start_codon:yes stop_codon:yes gene_type:complete